VPTRESKSTQQQQLQQKYNNVNNNEKEKLSTKKTQIKIGSSLE